jgi:hypothetical protein
MIVFSSTIENSLFYFLLAYAIILILQSAAIKPAVFPKSVLRGIGSRFWAFANALAVGAAF